MTNKEIIKKLIEDYEFHLDKIKRSKKGFKSVFDYCFDNNIHFGVCYYLSVHLKIDFKIPKINKYKRDKVYSNYWVIPPFWCETNKEIIKSFEKRITILKTL